MKLKPLFDKVVVKIIEEKEEKRGSFFLPSTAQEKSEIAEVPAEIWTARKSSCRSSPATKFCLPSTAAANSR